MARHLAIGGNVLSGTVTFKNTKTVRVNFDKDFSRRPVITLGAGDSGNFPVHRTSVSKFGFRVRCKNKWTGTVDWQATER